MRKVLISLYVILIAFRDYIFRVFILNVPFHWVRIIFIKTIVSKVGQNVTFLLGCEIRNGKKIVIGNNTVINKKVLLDGRGGRVVIGNNVDIAQETNIWTLEHDVNDENHGTQGGDVIIEDYVWIASRVTILPGVKIGRGAVVGSNSLVTKDVASMQIVGGVPAKVIGVRTNKLNYKLNYKPWFK